MDNKRNQLPSNFEPVCQTNNMTKTCVGCKTISYIKVLIPLLLVLPIVIYLAASYVTENKNYAVEMEKNPWFNQEQIEIEPAGTVERINDPIFKTFIANSSFAARPESVFLIRDGKPVSTVTDKTGCSLKQEFTIPEGYGYFCIPHVYTDVNGEVITEQ